MNCLEFRQLLDEHLDGALDSEGDAAGRAHVQACAICARLHAHSHDVQAALSTLPAPVPDAGFAERLFANVRAIEPALAGSHSSRRWLGAGAVAASLAAALALGAWLPQPATPQIAAGGLEPVRLVFRSESPVSGVTFELELPEGVELSGYPGQRRLVWRSDLHTGENLLELPLEPGGKGGVVTATLNLGAEQRRFSVRVVPSPERAAPASAAREPQRDGILFTAAPAREAYRHA